MSENIVLKMSNISKTFPGVKALSNVDFTLREGEIHALMGENGAGKSTLIKVLTGVHDFQTGEIYMVKNAGGKPELIVNHSPQEAQQNGISTVYQEVNLCPNLTVAENLFIGREPRRFGMIDWRTMNRKSAEVLKNLDIHVAPTQSLDECSLAIQQMIAIARAVDMKCRVLILDEPINGLDPIGIAEVRSFIRELCDARGKTILISSHILSEISLLADDIGIIDHGALLEEESLAELEQKSSKHIRFTLSDTAQAARILERNFHENHFSIQDDHNLRLHNLDLPVGKIVTAFVENGLEVSEAHTCEESLEDYFKRVTGGEGIA